MVPHKKTVLFFVKSSQKKHLPLPVKCQVAAILVFCPLSKLKTNCYGRFRGSNRNGSHARASKRKVFPKKAEVENVYFRKKCHNFFPNGNIDSKFCMGALGGSSNTYVKLYQDSKIFGGCSPLFFFCEFCYCFFL